MRNFRNTSNLALGSWLAAGIAAVTLTLLPATAAASRFNADEIETLITHMYGYYNGTVPSDLQDVDRGEYALVVAEELAALDAAPFNDVMGHLAADYGSNPDHRAAIEHIMNSTHDTVLPLLREYRDHSVFWTFVDDTFSVFAVVYAFQFGRSMWRSRGKGLQLVGRFREATQAAKLGRRAWLMTAGVGVGVGAVHNLYLTLRTQKLDPKDILLAAQRGVVGKHQEDMATLRQEVEGITSGHVRDNPRIIEERLTQVERSVLQAVREMEHISRVAPEIDHMTQTARDDAMGIRERLRDLWREVDSALMPLGEEADRPVLP